MKKSAITILIFCVQFAVADTPFRFRSTPGRISKIDFAYSTVNGVTTWDQADHNAVVAVFNQWVATSPVQISLLTPTAFEINLATCALNFSSADDFRHAQTKDGITTIISDLINLKNAYDASANNKRTDIQQRLDYLSSAARSLP